MPGKAGIRASKERDGDTVFLFPERKRYHKQAWKGERPEAFRVPDKTFPMHVSKLRINKQA